MMTRRERFPFRLLAAAGLALALCVSFFVAAQLCQVVDGVYRCDLAGTMGQPSVQQQTMMTMQMQQLQQPQQAAQPQLQQQMYDATAWAQQQRQQQINQQQQAMPAGQPQQLGGTAFATQQMPQADQQQTQQQMPFNPVDSSSAASPPATCQAALALAASGVEPVCPSAPVALSTAGLSPGDLSPRAPVDESAARSWSSARGFALKLVSVHQHLELNDPLDMLAALQGDNSGGGKGAAGQNGVDVHEHPSFWAAAAASDPDRSSWVEVDIDDSAFAANPHAAAYASATTPANAYNYGFPYASLQQQQQQLQWQQQQAAGGGFNIMGIEGDPAMRPSLDQIFDAEHSEFEAAGSGWSDPAVIVDADLGPCRGQLQPGRKVYCTRPGSRLSITVLAKNTGSVAWVGDGDGLAHDETTARANESKPPTPVRFEMNLMDALTWADPLATPNTLANKLLTGELKASGATNPDGSSALDHPAPETLRGTMHSLRLVGGTGPAGGACVAPGEVGVFVLSVRAPSPETTPLPLGLHGLRLTPVGPCGPMGRPLRVNLEVTCSDGLFWSVSHTRAHSLASFARSLVPFEMLRHADR
jgi:hypothetical protein